MEAITGSQGAEPFETLVGRVKQIFLRRGTTGHTMDSGSTTPAPLPYEIRKAESCGDGVFATRLISANRVIIRDSAKMIIPTSRVCDYTILQALYQLPADEQAQFMGLCEGKATSFTTQAARIYSNNAFSDMGKQYIYLKTSKINHSCTPNAMSKQVGDTGTSKVISLRPIQPGEEITISYDFEVTERKNRRGRRKFLQHWIFNCRCDTCAQVDEEEANLSDLRREMIGLLEWTVTSVGRMKNLDPKSRDFLLAHLYKKEGLLGVQIEMNYVRAGLPKDLTNIVLDPDTAERIAGMADEAEEFLKFYGMPERLASEMSKTDLVRQAISARETYRLTRACEALEI